MNSADVEDNSPCVRYFCTAGSGLEPFLVEEVKRKLAASDVEFIPGRVFFSTAAPLAALYQLKSAERLFLSLHRSPPIQTPANHAKASAVLQQSIVGDSKVWEEALSTWSRLRHRHRRAEDNTTRKRKRGEEEAEEEKRKRETEEEKKKRKEEEEKEEGCTDDQAGGERHTEVTGVQGRPRDTERRDEGSAHVTEVTAGQCQGHYGDTDECDNGSVDPRGTPGGRGDSRGAKGRDGGSVDPTGAPGGRGDSRDTAGRDDGSVDHPEPEQCRPTFRVSCRSSGALARRFSPQDLSRLIGSAISKQLHWRADLRQPQLEVNVYLSDDHCVVGILLSRYGHPLALRSYLRHTGLRSTVSWAMASLAHMKEGDVIMDPMCGVGSILLEAAQECPNGCFLGLDSDCGQLLRARENVEAAQLQQRVQLIQASAMGLPLSPGSVDVVLCDVPFGRKFSCGSNMATALPHIVMEMERVLCVGGTLVLLVSLQLSTLLKKKILKHAHDQPCPSNPATTLKLAQPCPSNPATTLKLAQPCPSNPATTLKLAHDHPSPSPSNLATITTTSTPTTPTTTGCPSSDSLSTDPHAPTTTSTPTTTTTTGCPSSDSLSRDTHAHTTPSHPPTTTPTTTPATTTTTPATTTTTPATTTTTPATINCPSMHLLSKDTADPHAPTTTSTTPTPTSTTPTPTSTTPSTTSTTPTPTTSTAPTLTTTINCPSMHPLSKDRRAFITPIHDGGAVLSSACPAPQPYCTLRTLSVHKVSLGSTDALIHTYIKTHGH